MIDSVAINLNHLGVVISPEDVKISSVNRAFPVEQRYVPALRAVQPPRVNIAPPVSPLAQPVRRDPPIVPNQPAPPRQEIPPPRPRRPNDNCTFL